MISKNRHHLFTVTLMLSVLVSGCSTISSAIETSVATVNPWHTYNAVESIGLKVNPSTALKHAVSVDIVFAYDENLTTLLTSVSAQQWFNERSGYKASYGLNMDIVHREIVPGYSEIMTQLPERHGQAKAVFAFAFFPTNPNAKAVLSEVATPWLIFDAGQMTMLGQAPGGEAEGDTE